MAGPVFTIEVCGPRLHYYSLASIWKKKKKNRFANQLIDTSKTT